MPGQTHETPVVGRDTALGDVARFVDAVAAAPAALLLEGEPGIGKTTLWRSAQAAAGDRGHRVLAATAVEGEADLPFVGLRDLFEDVARTTARRCRRRSARPSTPRCCARPTRRAVADPHAVCVAALGVVRALAAERPLVIAVDDVGWLDRSSDRVLRYVVRRLTTEPVGVLAARRPGARPAAPLGLDGPPLDARLHRVALGPLDRDAIHTLLTGRYGMALPRRLTRRIHAACGGNPFSAVEIGRTLLARGGADPRRGHAPAARRRAAGHRRAHRRAGPARAAGAGRGGRRRRARPSRCWRPRSATTPSTAWTRPRRRGCCSSTGRPCGSPTRCCARRPRPG